ncbi:MAG TPA: PspC domain-containing protein [Anaerolineae bacterium]|nr:PspC domain-containing protein [Anaerolineae bacterium]
MSSRRLTRSENDKMIAGVCGGLANYLDLDPVLIRLAFIILLFAGGVGLPTYLLMAFITPKESSIHDTATFDDVHFAADEQVRSRNRSTFFATLLIILGLIFFVNNLGVNLGILLPFLLIGFGIWQIIQRK